MLEENKFSYRALLHGKDAEWYFARGLDDITAAGSYEVRLFHNDMESLGITTGDCDKEHYVVAHLFVSESAATGRQQALRVVGQTLLLTICATNAVKAFTRTCEITLKGASWGSWVDLGAASTTDIQDGSITAQKLSTDVRGKLDRVTEVDEIKKNALHTESVHIVSAIDEVSIGGRSINGEAVVDIPIPVATIRNAGVMSAEDKASLMDIDKNFNGGVIDIATLGYTANTYYNTAGEIRSQAGFFTSEVIPITRGTIVRLTTNSTTLVSLISLTTKDGIFVGCVVSGKNGVNTYEWTAPIDCYIRISVVSKNGTIELPGHKTVVCDTVMDVYGKQLDIRGFYGIVQGAFRTDGIVSYMDSFSHSNPVPVKQGDVIRISNAVVTDIISLITKVNESGEYVTTLMCGVTNVKDYEYEVITDGYVSISMSRASFKENSAIIISSGIIQDIDRIERISGSPWKGRRIMAIGDSLTASTKDTNWQYVVGDMLGCNIRTHAKGGIGLIAMVDGDGTEKPEADPDNFGVSNIYRLEASDVVDVDLILLFGAFNEYRRARDEYGNAEDMYPDQNTYLGRLRYVAKRLVDTVLQGNPKCKIAFVEPYCFGGGSYCDATGYDVGVEMAKGLQTVANEFCFPCIPLLRNSQIARYNWDLYCAGGGTENTTYLPYDESIPYGTPSIFPSADLLPSTAVENIIALVAAENIYGYTYAQFIGGSWSLGHYPGGSTEYSSPYIYLWKDFIHLNANGQTRIAEYIARQVNTL